MIKPGDLKSGIYISSKNKDGRLVLKIFNHQTIYQYNREPRENMKEYLCELIEGKLYIEKQDYYSLCFMFLKDFEIAIDYMRDEKLKELGI